MATAMAKKKKTLRKTLPSGMGKVVKRLHYPLNVILLCVRWYVAYSLSLRNLEETPEKRRGKRRCESLIASRSGI